MSKKLIKTLIAILGIMGACILVSIVVASLFLNMSVVAVLDFYFVSTIFSVEGVLSLLKRTTYLLIIALGLIIAFKCSLGNIGAEGQVAFGALTTVGICAFLDLPPLLLIFLAFIMSFFVGGLWASIAGLLKAKWEINEFIVTVMQNFIALTTLLYLAGGPWKAPFALVEMTPYIKSGAELPFIKSPLNTVFLIALALVPVIYFLINKTKIGYELRAVGHDRAVSFNLGINAKRIMIISMFLSGAICALAGTSLVLGEFFYVQRGITANYGFYAIIVALFGESRPELMLISAILVAIILTGGTALTVLGAPARLGQAIMGFLFIAVVARKILERRF